MREFDFFFSWMGMSRIHMVSKDKRMRMPFQSEVAIGNLQIY